MKSQSYASDTETAFKIFLTTRGGKQQNVSKYKHLSLTIFISVNLLSLMYSDVEFFQ